MIPVMLPNGEIVKCSRPDSPIHLRHCPVCGDLRHVRLHAPIGRSEPALIDCPQCAHAEGLLLALLTRLWSQL